MNNKSIDKREWWKEAVVYQIYPRSFNDSDSDGLGDLRGVIEKLDYLKYLGIDAIWLCPIYKSPNDDNGYDISDYYDIMDEFGTLSDLDELIRKMHQLDMKLIMDLVANHTSDEHPWFVESKKSKDNYYRDFYYWRDSTKGREPNDWYSFFCGSAWEYDESTEQYYLHLFSKKQPDLNWENPKVREEIYKMMKYWIDKGVDGFRLDAINVIGKEDGLPFVGDGTGYNWGGEYFFNKSQVHKHLNEMNEKVLSPYNIMTVGETSEITIEDGIKYSSEKSKELSMVFHFEHMGLDIVKDGKSETKPIDPKEFKNTMSRWQIGLEEEGWNSIYLGNHDQTRIVSRFGNDKEYRVESAKMLATMLLTQKGTPYIYQGDEIGMTNLASKEIDDYNDVWTWGIYNDLKGDGLDEEEIMDRISKRSRDNARTPIQWDDSNNAGFTDGTPWLKVNENYEFINVAKSIDDEDSVLNYYRKLIKLRKGNPVFVYGRYEDIDTQNDNVYSYTRKLDNYKLVIILNLTDKETSFELPSSLMVNEKDLLISNYEDVNINGIKISLKAFQAGVFIVK